MKPTEPGTIMALLDDHATKGEHEAIVEMGEKCRRRAGELPSNHPRKLLWAYAAAACAYRAAAVERRLSGFTEHAMRFEADSERALRIIYSMTRGAN